MYMRIGLDTHELVHAHGAGLTHPAKIVALQTYQHGVPRTLLRMRRKLGHLGEIAARAPAARPRACDRAGVDVSVIDPDEALGGGTEDCRAAPLRKSCEGCGIRFAQAVVERADIRIARQ